jgi:hypothetical protein
VNFEDPAVLAGIQDSLQKTITQLHTDDILGEFAVMVDNGEDPAVVMRRMESDPRVSDVQKHRFLLALSIRRASIVNNAATAGAAKELGSVQKLSTEAGSHTGHGPSHYRSTIHAIKEVGEIGETQIAVRVRVIYIYIYALRPHPPSSHPEYRIPKMRFFPRL